MTVDDSLRVFIEELNLGYRIQYGAWRAGSTITDKYIVIRPTGGAPIALMRTPIYSLVFIGAIDGDALAIKSDADSVKEKLLTDWKMDSIVNMEASEPVFFQTDDARPVYEMVLNLTVTL